MKITFAVLSLSLSFLANESAFAQSCSNSQSFKCPDNLKKVCEAGLKVSTDPKSGWRFTNGSGKTAFYYDKSQNQWCRDEIDSQGKTTTLCGDKLKKEVNGTDKKNVSDDSTGFGGDYDKQTTAQKDGEIAYRLGDDGSLLISQYDKSGKFDVVNEMHILPVKPDPDRINTQDDATLAITTGPKNCSAASDGMHHRNITRDMTASNGASCDTAASRQKPVDLTSCTGDTNSGAKGSVSSSVGSSGAVGN